jgi:hypothetical protein
MHSAASHCKENCPRATITSANAKVEPANPGKVRRIDSDAEPYFAWMELASLMANITPLKITDIRTTVDLGKRNSGRMLNLVTDISGEWPLTIRRCFWNAPATNPNVSRAPNKRRSRRLRERMTVLRVAKPCGHFFAPLTPKGRRIQVEQASVEADHPVRPPFVPCEGLPVW